MEEDTSLKWIIADNASFKQSQVSFPTFLLLFKELHHSFLAGLINMSKIWKRSECNGARGVMVIVVGNGHGDTSSNPGRD